MGALEALRDMETGQVASRAVPVPGPTVEQGAQQAMEDPGTPWARAGSHTYGLIIFYEFSYCFVLWSIYKHMFCKIAYSGKY